MALAASPDPMLPARWRVTRAWRELEDVVSFSVVPCDGTGARFAPGQFNMLYAFGVGEAAISISGGAADGSEHIHTIRSVGAVSRALSAAMAGDMIGLRGPFGTGWPVAAEAGRHAVFVAGGLGLAPLRPAIRHVLDNRESYTGLTVVCGARSPDALLYPDEIRAWKSRFDTEVEITVDHAAPGWTGPVGVVTTRLDRALAAHDPARISAFVCGPEIMMRFAAQALTDAGVAADRIWLSMERNMKCATGFCGHCQYGPDFVCRDGPVFTLDRIARRLRCEEI